MREVEFWLTVGVVVSWGLMALAWYFEPALVAWWRVQARRRGYWTSLSLWWKRFRTKPVRRPGEDFVHTCELGRGVDLTQYFTGNPHQRWGDMKLYQQFLKAKDKWQQSRQKCKQCRLNQFLATEKNT